MKTKKIFLCLSVLFLISLLNFISLNAQWETCKNQNCYNVWALISNENNIYAGTDGCGVSLSTDNGDNWFELKNGLKGQFGLDIPSLAISDKIIFAGSFADGIFLSIDGGANWVQKCKGLPYVVFGDTLYPFPVNKMLIFNNNIFSGTGDGIYKTTNNGDNWTKKFPSIDTIHIGVYALAISGNNIFAGTYKDGVIMSIDNGENWIPKNNGLANLNINSLAINGNNIFAGTEGGFFLSTDNGDNWLEKDSGLTNLFIMAILVKDNYIYVGTNGDGIFKSKNDTVNWLLCSSGLPNLNIDTYIISSIIIKGNYIFASTRGGIFRARLSDLITAIKEPDNNNKAGFEIYPNPASSSVRVKYGASGISKIQISIFDLLGNEVFTTSEDCNIGTNEKTIDCRSLETGYYIVRLKQGERVETKPVVIIKN